MQRHKQIWMGSIAALAMILLVLDSQTALAGAKDGIVLCLYTIIPSLFPFFVLTSIISSSLVGRNIPFLRPIGKLCGVPTGGESLLLLGLIGGYPVGAQAVADAYRCGKIDNSTAKRLLGFCSNAGPAFLFGMVSTLFSSAATAWILWGIHILSALIVGIVLPDKKQTSCHLAASTPLTFAQALDRGIKIMASVCGWVVLFRVFISICERWFLWLMPKEIQACCIGLLELSNGCYALKEVSSEALRFVLSSCMLAFGGICVGMQTVTVCQELGTGMYFPGKLLQCFISLLLSSLFQQFLFPDENGMFYPLAFLSFLGFLIISIIMKYAKKKTVALCR